MLFDKFDDKPLFHQLDFKNKYISIIINNINIDNFINILIYGSKGNGKTITIYSLLATIFDNNVYNIKKNEFKDDNKSFIYYTSDYHLEFDPMLYGNNDKIFISNYLKYYIQTKNILFNIPKIIYIKNANYLSKQTQMILRRMIEINSITSCFILETNHLNSIIEPLRSRFYIIRHTGPSIDDIKNYISKNYNYSNEKINYILEYSNKISKNSNLKIIFGLLNCSNSNLFKFEFVNILNNLTKFLVYDVPFNKIDEIRNLINILYINQINSNIIINYIYNFIFDKYHSNNDFMHEFINITQKCDYDIVLGNKFQIHIELYIINIIKLIYKYT